MMREFILKIKNGGIVKYLKAFLSSKYYPFVTAAVTMICYYLSLDVISILYIGITGGLIVILCDDISTVLSPLLCISVVISFKNSPSSIRGQSDYYFRPENLVFIIFSIAFLSCSLIYRFIITCRKGKFTITPMFYGLFVLTIIFLSNGLIYKGVDLINLMFGAFMAVAFLFIFSLFRDNIVYNEKTYEKISLNFLAFSILLVIELIQVYLTSDTIFVNGHFDRTQVLFGWGVYTAYGMYITLCIPPVVYLAGRYKYGFVLTLYSALVCVATIMSCSRQAMVALAIIYPICYILLLIKGKNRIANLCIAGAAIVAGLIMFGVFFDKIIGFFKTIFANVVVNGELNGSGRMDLWRKAIEHFKQAPIFGVGFNVILFNKNAESIGFSFTPDMYHNTILQMLASCGLVGLAVYLFHRIQTIKSYIDNLTLERTVIALMVLAILIESLLDHHLLNIKTTMIYSILIAILDKTSAKKKPLYKIYDRKQCKATA